MTNAAELRAELGITERQLREWIQEGMPVERSRGTRRFDPSAVADWLVDHGKADREEPAEDGPYVTTRGEVAAHFGVSTQSVQLWQSQEGFPGRPGGRGTRSGYYPLGAIGRWLEANGLGRGPGRRGNPDSQAARAERDQIKTELDRIELQRQLGQVIDLEEVTRFVERTIAAATQVLQPLAEQVGELTRSPISTLREELLALLRSTCKAAGVEADEAMVATYLRAIDRALGELPRLIRDETRRVCDTALRTLAELVSGDQDEQLEDEEPADG